jgi:hypothetical protein
MIKIIKNSNKKEKKMNNKNPKKDQEQKNITNNFNN